MRAVTAAAGLAALGLGLGAASVHAAEPVPTRLCSDRGEGKGPETRFALPGDVVVGRVALRGLKRFSSRKVLLASVAGGDDRVYFAKAGAIVRSGAPVTISIVAADRGFASLVYIHGVGQGLGLGYPAERLRPCAPATKAFAYKGKVGPLTLFPGGFVVKRPACVRIVVSSPRVKPIRRVVSLGAGTCR